MNTFAMKLSSLVVLLLLTIPTGAHAYKFVDSSSLRLSDTTYLLTHTYTAGFLNEQTHTPIVATTDFETKGEYPRVGFSVEGISDAALQGAVVNALVLSDTAISKNQYQLAVGKRSTFTLFAIVTLPAPASAISDVSLSIKAVPFSYTRDGEEKTIVYTSAVSAQADETSLVAGE